MASWFSDLIETISPSHIVVLGTVSVITFLGTLLLLPILLIRIPEDYFVCEEGGRFRRGIGGILFHLIKNGLGLLFLVMGFIMLFIPGQGLLTILAGLWLMDLPGKRALEIRMIRNKSIYKGIDYIRRKAGKPSLRLPVDKADRDSGTREPDHQNNQEE